MMTPLHKNINTMMLLAMMIVTMLVSTSAFQGRGWSTTSSGAATTTSTTTTPTVTSTNEATIALNFPKYQAQYNKYFTCPILTRESIHRSTEDRILRQQQQQQQRAQQQQHHQQHHHQHQHQHTKLATAEVHLVDVEWLKPHEQVVGETHVNELLKATLRWGAYVAPLLVDRVTGAILDGHHRYHVGMRLGLQRVPAVLVDYAADTSIDVDVWEGCGRQSLTKQEVLEMALSGGVFPPKTSKHSFSDSLPPVLVPLAILQQHNFLRHMHSVPHIPHREAPLDYHI